MQGANKKPNLSSFISSELNFVVSVPRRKNSRFAPKSLLFAQQMQFHPFALNPTAGQAVDGINWSEWISLESDRVERFSHYLRQIVASIVLHISAVLSSFG